jgi:hypothetical protein
MDTWEKELACAIQCLRCQKPLKSEDKRILSIYDHQPICLACKKQEEQKPDYETVARQTIGTSMAENEMLYGDPGGFWLYHFYPFTCG